MAVYKYPFEKTEEQDKQCASCLRMTSRTYGNREECIDCFSFYGPSNDEKICPICGEKFHFMDYNFHRCSRFEGFICDGKCAECEHAECIQFTATHQGGHKLHADFVKTPMGNTIKEFFVIELADKNDSS